MAEQRTVLTFPRDVCAAELDRALERWVGALSLVLRRSGTRFEDPSFGPADGDELGARALYGARAVAPGAAGLSKYPAPVRAAAMRC